MIVCLAWGSLYWNPGALPIAGAWREDGPVLPVEFARQSNDDRITLVIAEGSQTLPVLWNKLSVSSLDEAREALREREDVPVKYLHKSIGHWSPRSQSHHTQATLIGDWAVQHQLDGVVWTALGPKFGGQRMMPTADDVIRHLSRLEGEKREAAKEYVERAPVQIRTNYRAVIERELGWTAATNAVSQFP